MSISCHDVRQPNYDLYTTYFLSGRFEVKNGRRIVVEIESDFFDALKLRLSRDKPFHKLYKVFLGY